MPSRKRGGSAQSRLFDSPCRTVWGLRAMLPDVLGHQQEETVGNLLYWAVVFLVVAIIAAALGFGGVAGTALAGAKLLFWVAIVLFVIALIGGIVMRGRV
jgi:uncharacterized membrane protein YtjA (UPF0391 family)